MNIIVIDDEPAPLLTFASHILDNAAVTANMFSLKVDEALEFARTHEHKDRKSTRLNSSHHQPSRMPSSA